MLRLRIEYHDQRLLTNVDIQEDFSEQYAHTRDEPDKT